MIGHTSFQSSQSHACTSDWSHILQKHTHKHTFHTTFHYFNRYDDKDQEEISDFRLWSEEHAGLFVSNQRHTSSKSTSSRTSSFRASSNVAGDLFVSSSNSKTFSNAYERHSGSKAVTSRCTKYWKPVDSWRPIALDRRDPKWIRNLGPVRHYIYEIHESKTFRSRPHCPPHCIYFCFDLLTINTKQCVVLHLLL